MYEGLAREIKEETGLETNQYQIDDILTFAEGFFPDWGESGMHSLSIIYRGFAEDEPVLSPQEIDTGEARWVKPGALNPSECSERSLLALREAGLISSEMRKWGSVRRSYGAIISAPAT